MSSGAQANGKAQRNGRAQRNSGAHWRRLSLALFLAAVVAALALGAWGFHLDAALAKQAPARFEWRYAGDVGYRTLQLFVLELNPRSYPIPVQLEVARWLAAIVAGVALFRAAQELFHERIADWRLRWLKNHVVICGLGRKGFELVRQLHARGERVIVIEIDEGDDSLPTCRELGVTVLVGDGRSQEMQRKAGVSRANRLLAVCKQDSDNIEIALQAWQLVSSRRRDAANPLLCHIHIIDLKLAELFKQHKVFSCVGDSFEARMFSFYENAARDLLIRHPLDGPPLSPRNVPSDRAIHLAIVGFGQMGESVALQAARIGHFANGRRLKLTVFDRQAHERRLNLLARYPQLEEVCDIAFDSRSIEDPDVRQQLTDWATSDSENLSIAICIDDDPYALSIALNLPAALRDRGVPVYVRQSEQRGLATVLIDRAANDALARNVISFGAPDVAAGLEHVLQEKLDELARAIHERYLAQRAATSGPTSGQPPTDPALQPWPQLEAALKSSNRQQADHIDVKLRAIGCVRQGKHEPLPAGGWAFEGFTPDEVELLARMEHDRWSADRLLAGWRRGKPADKQRKISEYLVPYEQLSEEIKKYDREAVLQIPELVDRAGQLVVRV